ncbi:N-6 DNA methylase [Thermomonas sp.]|uniref:N-6 DNA methylase n=1 Tax=Thermomonas sp. TaxID=1971895 RepID=UPI00391B4873
MNIGVASYNERSWAIDLIGHIKHLVKNNNRSIKDAGGEQTIRAEGGSLFPDVLLFGDSATARILQGWELKMPDTDINDIEFRSNAEAKARALGLDSFVLWNVTHARLYVRTPDSSDYAITHEWIDLADITARTAVVANRRRWEALATLIIGHLNDLFDGGTLEGRQFIDAYQSGGITELIMQNSGQTAEALAEAARRNVRLHAEITLWWEHYKSEYAGGNREQVLARAVISNWIGKILFAHILRERDKRAARVAEIDEDTTPVQALVLFERISAECNFWTIFSNSLALDTIPSAAWNQLKQFNRLLSDLRVGAIDQTQLSHILEATVEVALRKLRGQYPTPMPLARLLVQLCIRDTVDDRMLDPCCGSGTIARAALEQKLAAGVPFEQAAATVFAGDQDPQAVQIATFALAKPGLMHLPIRIFQRDAFTLEPNTAIVLRNPTDGSEFSETLGQFEAIASNLPFIDQNGRAPFEKAITRVREFLGQASARLPARSDIAAYLPFSLHSLLTDRGRLGIIITNAWLGTDWGDAFHDLLGRYYKLISVITSGAGRWFQNSDVVANILILEKKSDPQQPSGSVRYIVLNRPLEEMTDAESINLTAAQIELGRVQHDTLTIRSVDQPTLTRFRKLGLGGNAQFVDCEWILELPLVPLKNIFNIRRGERRGMNALFYPRPGHGIEANYIKPLAKGPSEFKRPTCAATREAFSCSRSLDELKALGHYGALEWIRRFDSPKNVKKLARYGRYWYEMKADALTDLVMFINYGSRLFVGRVNPPAFADQRLICLYPRGDADIDLCHALLNSTIAMFIIEGMGFGRGLGALDLNKDRIEDYMHMLDFHQLDQAGVNSIKAAFIPLLQREILAVADELEQADRKAFDDAVLRAFGIQVPRQRIYDALLALISIREAATN